MTLVLQAFRKTIHWANPVEIFRNLLKYRDLIMQMVKRDIGQRYKGSYLGLLWSVINPLIMLLIYTFVFSVVFKARWKPTDTSVSLGEFAITLFAGLVPFNLFSEVMNRAPSLISNYPNYVKKVVFPLEILVVVSVISALVTSLIGLAILIVAGIIFMGILQPTIIFLPLIYLPLILLSSGLGWILASLGVYIRDISQGISLVMQVLLFMSPIFYSPDNVPEKYKLLLNINPMSMIVTDFRNLLLWGELFPIKEWALWTIVGVIISILGYVWFMGTKKGFADVL